MVAVLRVSVTVMVAFARAVVAAAVVAVFVVAVFVVLLETCVPHGAVAAMAGRTVAPRVIVVPGCHPVRPVAVMSMPDGRSVMAGKRMPGHREIAVVGPSWVASHPAAVEGVMSVEGAPWSMHAMPGIAHALAAAVIAGKAEMPVVAGSTLEVGPWRPAMLRSRGEHRSRVSAAGHAAEMAVTRGMGKGARVAAACQR